MQSTRRYTKLSLKNSFVGRPTFVPEIWSQAILEAYTGESHRPPHMISQQKLKQLTEESADVPQLEDLHAALKELQWRRLNQGKLDNQLKTLKRHIDEVRPKKSGGLRRLMSRLKF